MSASAEDTVTSNALPPGSPFSRVLVGATGTRVPAYLDEDIQRASASDALERALQAIRERADVAGKIVQGCPWDELVDDIERGRDTLVAVGSHGTGRARGILIGSTATELVHKAPCSVLVTRRAARIPRRVVVGSTARPSRPAPTRSPATSQSALMSTCGRSSITEASLST
jgi:nucleotide-binding universal stress UspA family protein